MEIEDVCFGLEYKNVFTSNMGTDLTCLDYINYDVDSSGKVVLVSADMFTTDEWEKKYELIEVGYDDPTNGNLYYKLPNLNDYKVASPGFVFGNDSKCLNFASLIYLDSFDCDAFFDNKLKNLIGNAYFYMEIIAIVLMVGLSVKDYATAILSSDQDAMKKCNKYLLTRVILVVVILLLPSLLKSILGIFNIDGIGSNDPLCDVINSAREKVK